MMCAKEAQIMQHNYIALFLYFNNNKKGLTHSLFFSRAV